VAKDDAEAVNWLRKAAELGEATAQSNLGAMYMLGRGVAKDEAEAATWIRKAAEQGLAMAQHNLGIMYENGQGVAKDETEAVVWYRKAAAQGYAPAQNALAPLLRLVQDTLAKNLSFPVPGATVSDVRLQRDAANRLLLVEATLDKGCSIYAIRNTEAVVPYRDAQTKWTERWTAAALP
jgi:TPR repeat protein